MPGGLATWLDDDVNIEHENCKGTDTGGVHTKPKNRPNFHAAATPLPPSRGFPSLEAATGHDHPPLKQNQAVIDMEAVAYSKSTASTASTPSQSSITATAAVAEALWDPFLVKQDMTTPSKPNAFARLLQGASSATKQPSSTEDNAQPITPVSLVSAWDPFASGDGKENNAFSKMLAATLFSSSSSTSRVKGGRSSGAGKRKRPVGSLGLSGGAAADANAGVVAATTRFCECPVCGKRVSQLPIFSSSKSLARFCGIVRVWSCTRFKVLEAGFMFHVLVCHGPNGRNAPSLPMYDASSTVRFRVALPNAKRFRVLSRQCFGASQLAQVILVGIDCCRGFGGRILVSCKSVKTSATARLGCNYRLLY